jgi:drug/metabolite transporter (DMT)-like permease
LYWLIPALGYILVNGTLGVSTKLALRHNTWPELLLWAAVVYAVVAFVLYFASGARFHGGFSSGMAVVSGVLAASGLILYYIGVRGADVTRVVPIMSIYPVVTLLLGALILSEPIKPGTIVGVALILGGLFFLTR